MKGYATIAASMAKYPESAMFRQFHALAMQDLLYLQAELDAEASNDASQSEDGVKFSQDWYPLSSAMGADEANEQWTLALRIREKLKEYSVH